MLLDFLGSPCIDVNVKRRSLCLSPLQMGAGLASAPVGLPASLSAPVSSGLDDLFDLGGGVGMPTGAYVVPKTVSPFKCVQTN